ncbi:hypothetical protein LCGC14_1814670, partial [marine sediment metagenome]
MWIHIGRNGQGGCRKADHQSQEPGNHRYVHRQTRDRVYLRLIFRAVLINSPKRITVPLSEKVSIMPMTTGAVAASL